MPAWVEPRANNDIAEGKPKLFVLSAHLLREPHLAQAAVRVNRRSSWYRIVDGILMGYPALLNLETFHANLGGDCGDHARVVGLHAAGIEHILSGNTRWS